MFHLIPQDTADEVRLGSKGKGSKWEGVKHAVCPIHPTSAKGYKARARARPYIQVKGHKGANHHPIITHTHTGTNQLQPKHSHKHTSKAACRQAGEMKERVRSPLFLLSFSGSSLSQSLLFYTYICYNTDTDLGGQEMGSCGPIPPRLSLSLSSCFLLGCMLLVNIVSQALQYRYCRQSRFVVNQAHGGVCVWWMIT